MNICPVCRVRNSDAATQCRSCGNPLPPARPKTEPPSPASEPGITDKLEDAELVRQRTEERTERERQAKAAAEEERRAKAAEEERRAKAAAEEERRAKAAAEEDRAKAAAEEDGGERTETEADTGTRLAPANEAASVPGTLEVGTFLLRLHKDGTPVVEALPPRAAPPFHPVGAPPAVRPQRQHFVGRVAELARVRSLLTQRSSRPAVVLAGPHGSGKTSMLTEIAHDENITSLYPDGVFYVRSGHRTADDILQFVFRALFECRRSFRPTNEELHSALAGKRVLLLLDDVHEGDDALAEMVRSLPNGGLVVAANQETIAGSDQATITLGALSEAAARELLEFTVGRKHALESGAADALCKSLEGNPLRIAQIGALARDQQRSLLTIVEDIGSHPSAAALDRYVASGLVAAERAVLEAATAFSGAPFDAALIGAVANIADIDPILEALWRRRVLVRAAGLYEVGLRVEPDPLKTTTWIAKAIAYLSEWLNEPEVHSRAAIERIEPFLSAVGSAENIVDFNQSTLISACSIFSGVCVLCDQWGLALSTLEVTIGIAKHVFDREAEARSYDLKGTILLLAGRADEARSWLALAYGIYEEIKPEAAQAATSNYHTVTGKSLAAAPTAPQASSGEPQRPNPVGEAEAPEINAHGPGAFADEEKIAGPLSHGGARRHGGRFVPNVLLFAVVTFAVLAAVLFVSRPTVRIYLNDDGALCHDIRGAARAEYQTPRGSRVVGPEHCLDKDSLHAITNSWIQIVAYGQLGFETVSDRLTLPSLSASSSPLVAVLASPSPAVSVVASSSPAISVVASSSPVVGVSAWSSPLAGVPASSSPVVGVSASSSPAVAVGASSSPAVAVGASSSPAVAVSASSLPAVAVSASSSPAVAPSPSPRLAPVRIQVGKVVWVAAHDIDVDGTAFDVPTSVEVVAVTAEGNEPMSLTRIPPGSRVSLSYMEKRKDLRVAKSVRVLSIPIATPSPTASASPPATVALRSPVRVFIQISDTHFVTAVEGGGGVSEQSCAPGTVALDTSAVTIGPWQTFALLPLGDDQYALRTAGGQYVTAVAKVGIAGQADSARESRLHTDATSAKADEFFTLVPAGDGIAVQTADGVHYVTAVNGGGCAGSDSLPFRTNSATIGESEKFWIIPTDKRQALSP